MQHDSRTGVGSHSEQSAKKKILVIDSSSTSRQQLCAQLGGAYELIGADDGDTGLRILQQALSEFSMVILDIAALGGDGIHFLERMRVSQYLQTIPVIVMSERADPADECRFFDLGASDYIVKPANENVLLSRVRSLIRLKDMMGTIDFLETDNLTQLLTRQAFFHHAQKLLGSAPNQDFSMILTDIDRFSFINAIYGEKNADILLQSMAASLKSYVTNGICGRFGTDRFMVITRTENISEEWLRGLLSRLTQNPAVPDVVVRCGVYNRIDRSLSMHGICSRAVFAMRSIKSVPDKTIAYYDGVISQRYLREQSYTLRASGALRNEEFVLWYQPKYDPYSNTIVAAEALVRWRNPDGSLNPPGEFLPILEANGMMRSLDAYIFEKVCRFQRHLADVGLPLIPISINLSRSSMHQNNLAALYGDIAKRYGISPAQLPIEITETTAVGSNSIKAAAAELSGQGFPLHMDDFGSEHSSLYTLNVLGFNTVKLDKGLIDFIGDKVGDIILTCVITLSKTLGIHIVAEGVERKEQLDFLMKNGCDQIQGYYFSRPLPEDVFEQKLREQLMLA